jgi:hypothetical protein
MRNGTTMGTGNVADDDEESLVFADEGEYGEFCGRADREGDCSDDEDEEG